jgi:hypothetical protein
VVIFGALLNGIVYVANDFTMPVLVSGPERLMDTSASECMFVGAGTYKSHTQTYWDTRVNLPYLADWIYIDQSLVRFHRWSRPLRFLPSTIFCFPDGAGRASPGDLLMWGGLFSLIPLLLFMGVLSVFRFIRRLRILC